MDMILETTNLCKNFKGHLAVNQVSLHIERNSIYGLLRPNGAGKFIFTTGFIYIIAKWFQDWEGRKNYE